MLVRAGTLVTPRMVRLSCDHEFPHPTKGEGDRVACRECRPKRVYRSHLNEHTISPWRLVVRVLGE